jgi:hypothetical protein
MKRTKRSLSYQATLLIGATERAAELSSRPERSEVEGSAVQQVFAGNVSRKEHLTFVQGC